MKPIDLNCDLGEGVVDPSIETALLDSVTSANIACGGHAGDVSTIRRLALACAARGTGIGAHPSYPDRKGFGRESLALTAAEIEKSVLSQLQVFASVVEGVPGARIAHIKPHGALYHDAMQNLDIADAIARAARGVAPAAVLVGQAGLRGLERWKESGFRVAREAFADRKYEPDGTLRSRKLPGALLQSPSEAAAQAVMIAREGRAFASDGSSVWIDAETICLHSDTPGAVDFAAAVRRALMSASVQVCRMGAA
ncbi:MAG: LamB/YcsF family protein [Phycisphaeraceae bacterium]|nr:LamB/YcsF family protein [Phycisphaeraceae bacterium]